MSEKSLKISDNSYCNLELISPVTSHGLTVHQVSTESDENCRGTLTEISHI